MGTMVLVRWCWYSVWLGSTVSCLWWLHLSTRLFLAQRPSPPPPPLSRQQTTTLPLHCRLPPRTKIVRVFDNLPMVVYDQDDDFISHHLSKHGYWEVDRLYHLQQLSQTKPWPKFGTVIDVGAHLGYYSLLLASYGYTVLAVEPNWNNVLCLQATLCLNPHLQSTILVRHVALSSRSVKNQTCALHFSDAKNHAYKRVYRSGAGRLECAATAGTNRSACGNSNDNDTCQTVPVSTLDEVWQEFVWMRGPIDNHETKRTANDAHLHRTNVVFLKLDVEGHELAVLHGATRLFQSTDIAPALVQFESKQRPRQTVADWLRARQYTIVETDEPLHDGNTFAKRIIPRIR